MLSVNNIVPLLVAGHPSNKSCSLRKGPISVYTLFKLLQRISLRLMRLLRTQRNLMADVAAVKADIAALDVKVDAILAVVASQPPVVATQAELDEIDAAVNAVAAKLP